MALKDTLLDLAAKLQAAEQVAPTPELEALHIASRRALYFHRDELGLSDADVSEIDNLGVAARGGTPKGPPPKPE